MALPRKVSVLSVVVPCFNEEAVVMQAHQSLTAILAEMSELAYELLYVDDGSQDRTAELLRSVQFTDNHVKVIHLSRNFGHQIAVTAGIEHASGDAIVLIDADLQDPPRVIHEMVARWRDGYDVVYGVRLEREGESFFKRYTAKIFYRLINSLSDLEIPVDTGDFRLMDRRVVEALRQMPERDRFIRGMVSWTGFRQTPVYYHRAARMAGTSKYPLRKMLSFATDGILSFSAKPLKLATLLGFLSSGIACVGIVYALVLRIFTSLWVPGWTLLFVGILFLGGIQLISLGIMGEYLGRIYGEVKHRPLYLVKQRLGFDDHITRHETSR